MKTEESKWVGGSGCATGAPSAQAQFSSLHDIRFGKLGLHALAPVAHPLSFARLRSSVEFKLQNMTGFAHSSATVGGGATLDVREPIVPVSGI